MVVDSNRLSQIIDRVVERLATANDDGSLAEVLIALGLQDLVGEDEISELDDCGNAFGDILVLGHHEANVNLLRGIAEDRGYDQERFNFIDDGKIPSFDVHTLRHAMRYAAVMCGPVPESAGGARAQDDMLEALGHSEDGYPPVVELRDQGGAGALRITTNTFRAGLAQLEDEGAIRPNRRRYE